MKSKTAFLIYALILAGCEFRNETAPLDLSPTPAPSLPPVNPPQPTAAPNATPSPAISVTPSATPGPNQFSISGQITYDFVPATDGVQEAGPKLDYSQKTTKPARRVVVQAMESGAAIVQTTTNDKGEFTLLVPLGKTVTLRVRAWLLSNGNVPDGIAPNNCEGASWDIKVVDNTQSKGNYVMDSQNAFSSSVSSVNFRAPIAISGNTYTNRAGAPFAILDTVVSELELICQGQKNAAFPKLFINWSPNNVPVSGNKAAGQITTSHYVSEDGSPNLYILGKENVDTDEFDDHVIAHELGHYMENNLYRADTIGGSHSQSQSLDPRVAHSEGFGNAISAMVSNDPFYVDTSGVSQASGFVIKVSNPPSGDGRGVYSEASAQYLLWSLFANRAPSASYDRIHQILANFHKTTPAFTTLQSFAAYYRQQFGDTAENLQSLWVNDLDLPFASLTSGGAGDPFDLDNDIGKRICAGCESVRKYPQGIGAAFPAEFWALYKTVGSGANAPNAHDQIRFGDYASPSNKFGGVRWYRFIGTGNIETLTLSNPGGGVSCNSDFLDLYVYNKGQVVAKNEDTSGSQAGCPSVLFGTVAGEIYLITVNAFTGSVRQEVPSWTLTITP